ncbi:MAG: LuxR C-terminal-related transcriptional regulator [Arcicella sp.]|nr:LuxR C-terminal-related transcriptional regulator [Arcicella sp.]
MILTSQLLQQEGNQTLRLFSLTRREWDVLMESTNFGSNKEIADVLCITPESVSNYKLRIKEKLYLDKGSGSLTKYLVQNMAIIKETYSVANLLK